MAETNSKELIIKSEDEYGYVDVTPKDTLSQVRLSILEVWEEEMIPAFRHPSFPIWEVKEFTFKVNGIRISTKQEAHKLAFDLLANQAEIEIVPMNRAEIFEHNYHQNHNMPPPPTFFT
jgi:hypothetical protein